MARGGVRIVTLAVVYADIAFARVVLRAHGKVEDVPVVGVIDIEVAARLRGRGPQNSYGNNIEQGRTT